MSCKWVNAKPGKKFVLTELGGENARIREKYKAGYSNRLLYEQKVPVNWVEKGYVREVVK